MAVKPLKLATIFAVVAVIIVSFWMAERWRERYNAAKRKAAYQLTLSKYQTEVKLGMPRQDVELLLHNEQAEIKHMCCVANYRGEALRSSTYDDLVKIGEEAPPWFCSEHNVYIAFEFNPKLPGEQPETHSSDSLKRVSLFHQLEGCL